MPEADVTYADVKFTRPRTTCNLRSSEEITYSEVKILKSEPPVCGNCSQKPAGSNRKCHVTSERAALLVLSLLLLAAVITIGVTGLKTSGMAENYCEYDLKAPPAQKEENEALRRNVSEYKPGSTVKTTCPPPSCPKTPQPTKCTPADANSNKLRLTCDGGWELHGGKCYYFTTYKLSWKQSRSGCEAEGGDLVKIDSREEQMFLEARLRDKMEEHEDKFWIGLTDSVEEGRWMWVDGSSLHTCLIFWSKGEPDNWKGRHGEHPDGEDCVRMGEKGGGADLKCWFDKNCTIAHKSICEKAAATR